MNTSDLMGIAVAVSASSKDPNRKVGAIIVTPFGDPIAWGYNGFPRRLNDDHRLYDPETKLKLMVHAELNAIINCARQGHRTVGNTLVCTLAPCVKCSIEIIQAGITHVVCPDTPALEPRSKWAKGAIEGKQLLAEAGVCLTYLY